MKRAYLWAVIAAGLLLAGELPMETHDAESWFNNR